MADQFQSVSRAWRIVAIIVGSLISTLFLLLSLWSWLSMWQQRSFDYDGKPFWIGALIITFAGLAASFVTWRLIRRDNAASGTTLLPLWFIRTFGVFAFCLLSAAAYLQDSIFMMAGAALVSLPMILFGKGVSKSPRH